MIKDYFFVFSQACRNKVNKSGIKEKHCCKQKERERTVKNVIEKTRS